MPSITVCKCLREIDQKIYKEENKWQLVQLEDPFKESHITG